MQLPSYLKSNQSIHKLCCCCGCPVPTPLHSCGPHACIGHCCAPRSTSSPHDRCSMLHGPPCPQFTWSHAARFSMLFPEVVATLPHALGCPLHSRLVVATAALHPPPLSHTTITNCDVPILAPGNSCTFGDG